MSRTIEKKCIAKGVKLTEQRKIIAKVISDSKETYGSKDHPDVDELHKRATSIDNRWKGPHCTCWYHGWSKYGCK